MSVPPGWDERRGGLPLLLLTEEVVLFLLFLVLLLFLLLSCRQGRERLAEEGRRGWDWEESRAGDVEGGMSMFFIRGVGVYL